MEARISRCKLIAYALIASAQITEATEACTPPPPPIRLPNESGEAYKLRSAAVFRALSDEERRSFQVTLYDRSNRVFLGLIEGSETVDAAGVPGHRVTVRPVAVLKGDLPSDGIILADRYMTTCGPAGGGTATAAQAGDYVIVLEGDLFREGPEAYGLRMDELREPRILKALNDVAKQSAATPGDKVEAR